MTASFSNLVSKYPLLPSWATERNLRYALHLPEETPSNNAIKGMHFHVYKKERENWLKRVQASLVSKMPPIQTSGLVVVRHCAGSGLDWDNVYGGLKPMLDCLVEQSKRNPSGLGLIADDNSSAMPEPPYVRQEKAKMGQGFTELFIFDVGD